MLDYMSYEFLLKKLSIIIDAREISSIDSLYLLQIWYNFVNNFNLFSQISIKE